MTHDLHMAPDLFAFHVGCCPNIRSAWGSNCMDVAAYGYAAGIPVKSRVYSGTGTG